MVAHNRLIVRLALSSLAGAIGGAAVYMLGAETNVGIALVRGVLTLTELFASLLNFVIPILIFAFVSEGLASLGVGSSRLVAITLVLAYVSAVVSGLLAYWVSAKILPAVVSLASNAQGEARSVEAFFELGIEMPFTVTSALVLAFIIGLGMRATKAEGLRKAVMELRKIVTVVLEKAILPIIPIYAGGMFFSMGVRGEIISVVGSFVATSLLIIALQFLYVIFLYAASSAACKKNYMKKLAKAVPAYLAAFATQSSVATIPITLECAYESGIGRESADFCIPLCATVHLAGDMIAIVVSVVSALVSGGQSVGFGEIFVFILMLGATMLAAPGVPGGGVMSAHGLINSMFALGGGMEEMIIAMHLAQDSFGTAANVTGDLALAAICERFAARTGKSKTKKKEK